jgi:hypothetical protein
MPKISFPTLDEKPKTDDNPSESKSDFIGDFLGPIGKWQIRTIFLVYLTKIPSSWFMACIIFTGEKKNYLINFCASC